MSVPATEPTTDPAADPNTPPPAGDTPPPADPPADPPAGESSENDLPDWAKKELTRARAEAANYRTRAREAQDALKQAKTPEEFQAAVDALNEQVAKAERAALVASTARKFNLPDDLAEVLQGTTAEELEAHAKKLQRYASPGEPQRLGGGLDPTSSGDDGDGIAAAKRALSRRY